MKVLHFFFEKKEKTKKKEREKKDLIEAIILEKYQQYYRLAYSYVHNEADASDIVQNGAYKALRSSYTLEQVQYAETWVYRIMLNECFQYLKRPSVLSYEAIQEENGIETEVTEDPDQNLDLQRALETLSDRDRVVIILKYFEDKKLEEIADILEENVSTVKSRLYRSIKKLRMILSEETNETSYNLKSETGG